MKIDGYQPVQPYGKYPLPHQGKQPGTAPAQSDKVEISSEAKRMQGAHRLEQERLDKVQNIKAQVDAGTYHVSSEDIARKMYAWWNRK